jgi:hypothetical protein
LAEDEKRQEPSHMNTSTMQTYPQTPTKVVRAPAGIDFADRPVGNRGEIPPILGTVYFLGCTTSPIENASP